MPGTASVAANHFLGRGKLYIDRWDSSDVSTGERYVGNASLYELAAPEDDFQEVYDYGEAETPLLDRQSTKRKMTMKATLHEFTAKNLALALMGTESAHAQGTGTVTDEEHIAKLGTYIKLDYRNVSSVVVMDDEAETFDLNDDYTVDATTGRIYLVPGGAIEEDEGLEISYSYAAVTATKILVGMSTTIEGSLRFIGSPKRGKTFEVEVWHFSLTPEGVVGLIGDEYGEFSLNFEILADSTNHPTEKFYRVTDISA